MDISLQLLKQNRWLVRSRFILLLLMIVFMTVMLSWWFAVRRGPQTPALAESYFTASVYRAGTSTDRLIETLQTRLQSFPNDWPSYSQLGLAYLQKAREIGDPVYYQKAEGVLRKALSYDSQDYVSLSALGSLALARHQFREALEWGEHAQQINPDRTFAYGVIADAQIELGKYEEAVDTLQTMVDLHPDMSSYSRISYIRELHGDTQGAIEMMQWAVDAGGPSIENTAWTRTQLANLYFVTGDLENAEVEYLRTLAGLPDYVYALAGLGRVQAAQDQVAKGIELLTRASAVMPLPEFIIALGDLYQISGQSEAAQKQYELLKAIQQLYQANGVDLNLEIALFNADHDIDPEGTLVQARQAYLRRPSLHAADVLAWVLYKAGRYEEASSYSQEALRLGTKDALMLFHAGMISYQLGEYTQARAHLQRALEINPHFDILHPRLAEQTLVELAAKP